MIKGTVRELVQKKVQEMVQDMVRRLVWKMVQAMVRGLVWERFGKMDDFKFEMTENPNFTITTSLILDLVNRE